MIITDKFVYIHMPKTGGTFVTQVLKQIHEGRGNRIIKRLADEKPTRRWSLRQLVYSRPTFLMLQHWDSAANAYNQHGKVCDIPPEHRHKPILTTVRNPYDRYVSGYEFRWWASYPPPANTPAGQWLREAYPHFPELSFGEYLHMANDLSIVNLFGSIDANPRFSQYNIPGKYTWQFIHYYFKNSELSYQLDLKYVDEKRYRADVRGDIVFLDTNNLNAELHTFLLQMGYKPNEIEFIKTQQKIHPKRGGRSEDQKWEKYYTPELKQFVRQRERMLFDLFPAFDI